MSTIRFFGGGRDQDQRKAAREMMKFNMMAKGKLDPAARYKRLLKKRFEENKKKAGGDKIKSGFKFPGNIREARGMSKSAEEALKQMSAKKAAKEAKALRQMVVVAPKTYTVGRINKAGKIYDVQGNLVARVNRKNGNIRTTNGTSLGKYRAKSYMTNLNIQDGIRKYSPYFLNLQRLQSTPQVGVWGDNSQDVINVYSGVGLSRSNSGSDANEGSMGRANIGVTAWGAMSDNTWGTFSDNVWGTMSDNVWGGTESNVWGGIGTPTNWGKSIHIWGTGNGKNYIKGITRLVAAFFGISSKGNRDNLRALRSGGGAGRSGGTPSAPRSGRR